MKSAVHEALSRHGVEPGGRVWVAFSGGADSTVLLLAVAEAGYRPTALHCNFHLRGAESNRDEAFCRELCQRHGIPLEVKHFNVAEQQRLTGESVEMAARTLRYEWFSTFAPGPILTAHHRSDNAETFLLNLMRSSGLRGLRGIPAQRGIFLRPLLDVERQTLLQYLAEKGEQYVTDSTNLQTEYRRNRVRHNVLPTLTEAFPGAEEAIVNTAANLRRDYSLLQYLLAAERTRFTSPDGAVNLALLAPLPVAAELLYHLLHGHADHSTILRILASATESGRLFEGAHGHRWLLDRGWLRPLPSCPTQASHSPSAAPSAAAPMSDPSDSSDSSDGTTRPSPLPHLHIESLPRSAFAPDRSGTILWLDGEALATRSSWVLRPWREGDRLQPYGMKGSRLVSDILSDAKVPLTEKSRTLVLTCGDRLLWVVGHRTSRHFPVTPSSTTILKITLTQR